MIVAGVMSGTSADGINVAIVRVSGQNSPVLDRQQPSSRMQLIGYAEYPYSRQLRSAILAAMNSNSARVADLARLNFLLGEIYAEAVLATQRKLRVKADLVGSHGQTLYHQGETARFLGHKLAATWQSGEGAVIAARTGVPVVSDFRPADMAAGGKGAPLVPFLDFILFHDSSRGRIIQNIGGIANLTFIPAGASTKDVIAFDTGPGNMVIDAVMEKLFGERFDRNGRVANSGNILGPIVQKILRSAFFRRSPPKTAGREEFGREFTDKFLRLFGRGRKQDIVATATALTAQSIAMAIQRFIVSKSSSKQHVAHELIVSGGGAKNATLMQMLTSELKSLAITVHLSNEYGLPSEAKEAAAFAVLAYETWHRRPSNLHSATGAKRAVVLGKVSYP